MYVIVVVVLVLKTFQFFFVFFSFTFFLLMGEQITEQIHTISTFLTNFHDTGYKGAHKQILF